MFGIHFLNVVTSLRSTSRMPPRFVPSVSTRARSTSRMPPRFVPSVSTRAAASIAKCPWFCCLRLGTPVEKILWSTERRPKDP